MKAITRNSTTHTEKSTVRDAVPATAINVVRLDQWHGTPNGVCIAVPTDIAYIEGPECAVYLTQREARILLNRLTKVVNGERS